MRLTTGIAAGIMLWVGSAAAQNEPPKITIQLNEMRSQIEQMLTNPKIVGMEGAVMGSAVKGAPYSADEVRESTQTLGDGTRIHNESKVSVYRDSEGRLRRETPTEVTIWDPVSGTTYVLDPKTMTYRKMEVHVMVRNADGRTGVSTYVYSSNSERGLFHGTPGETDPPRLFDGLPTGGLFTTAPRVVTGGGDVLFTQKSSSAKPPVKESLGSRMIEGVNSEGEKNTTTIDAGAIGNDRPISAVSERWYSPELQLNMMTVHSDPRSGEETFRLMNVRRGDPDPALFLLPPGYQPAGPTKL